MYLRVQSGLILHLPHVLAVLRILSEPVHVVIEVAGLGCELTLPRLRELEGLGHVRRVLAKLIGAASKERVLGGPGVQIIYMWVRPVT
jgi:hypothetical protein